MVKLTKTHPMEVGLQYYKAIILIDTPREREVRQIKNRNKGQRSQCIDHQLFLGNNFNLLLKTETN